MGTGAVTTRWQRLNVRRRHARRYLREVPWRYGLFTAVVWTPLLWLLNLLVGYRWSAQATAVWAVLFFLAGTLEIVLRRRFGTAEPVTDLPPRLDEPLHRDDGRRWREPRG